MKLEIQGTSVTPEVKFDIGKRSFIMKGRSMPENAEKFYARITDWLRANVGKCGIRANFDMLLEYYNTGSFIRLMALFDTLAELNGMGNEFVIRWFCEDGDQDNINDGQSFKEVVKLPFETHLI